MKQFIGTKNNRSLSDDGSYIAAVIEAVNDYGAFTKFKKDPRYTAILEHATAKQGQECLEIIETESPELIFRINDFKDNDLEGGAATTQYEILRFVISKLLLTLKIFSVISHMKK
jgi:hypothetical protein